MPVAQQPLAHVRADEARGPGQPDPHAGFLSGRDARAACPRVRRSERTSKPSASEQLAERAAREEAQVRRERVEAALEPPAAMASAGGATVRRRGHRQPAAGRSTRRASDRSSCTSRTCSIVSAQSTSSNARVGERQRRVGRQLHVRRRRHTAPRARERHRRHVGQRQLVRAAAPPPGARRRSRGRARCSTGVERAHEGGQVLRRRRLVVGHELPELVVEAAGYQAPFARITAGTVFSRIERSRKTDQCSR